MKALQFAPPGPLAILPQAFGQAFAPPAQPAALDPATIPVLAIRGPLLHHPELTAPEVPWGFPRWFLSYDELKARAAEAMQAPAPVVVLAIDSPGGVAAGAIDAAREIRAMAKAAGKRIVAFVEGAACSAAYALACAADEIWSSESGLVGSIGVIEAIREQSAADEKLGVRWELITSGSRKADGNPHAPITDEAIAARQKIVNELASVFHALVAERRGVTVEAVRDLECATFTAREAKALGLVDGITTFDQLLASLAANEGQTMTDEEKARAALRAIVDGDGDEKAKARARRALAAMDEEEDKDSKAEGGEEENGEAEDKAKKSKAEGGDEDPKDDARASAGASAAAAASSTASDPILERIAALEQRQEQTERANLYASRPDLTKEQIAALDKLPVAAVREFLATLPRQATNPVAAARAALSGVSPSMGGAPGAESGKPQSTALSPYAADLDRLMGLSGATAGARCEGNRLILSALGGGANKEAK